jgi:DNA-binding beta-propeller fold protein YncE
MNRMWTFLALVLLALPVSPVQADKVQLVAGLPQSVLQSEPFAIGFDDIGSAYVAEYVGRVIRVDARGALAGFAGTGKKGFSGDGGPARAATFDGLHSLAVAPDGNVYLADTWNCRIRKIDRKTGIVTTFAGTGVKGYGGDGGPADRARFGNLYCAAFDPRGERLYLADLDNLRIRAIDMKTGVVTTVAGNGKKGVPADGADARAAPLVDPRAVAVDRKGNVYVLERGGHALRVVDRHGKIRTVAGTGRPGFTGDGGDARRAQLNGPKYVCIDPKDNVLICDTENHVIRKYLPGEAKIVRVAGTGKRGTAGLGGPPERCELNRPHGVAVHPSGDLFIADSGNLRVLRVRRE